MDDFFCLYEILYFFLKSAVTHTWLNEDKGMFRNATFEWRPSETVTSFVFM
jgi:hypothetical protein